MSFTNPKSSGVLRTIVERRPGALAMRERIRRQRERKRRPGRLTLRSERK